MNDQMMLQQLLQMMQMGVDQPDHGDPTHVDSPINPLSQMTGNAQMAQNVSPANAPWPSQLPTATPDPPAYKSPLSGLGPQLPPAHQGFYQRFLSALRGQYAGHGTGSQSSAPLQPQLSPQTPGSAGQIPPDQLQKLIQLLLQRGQV